MKRPMVAIFFLLAVSRSFAQDQAQTNNALMYEVLYDEPFAINKLFVHIQPLYGELFAGNVNAGFGLRADYYLRDKADFSASFRKAYGHGFLDLNKDQAIKNSDVDNSPRSFSYFELGGSYHIRDFEASATTKIVLYSDSLKGNKWAARVPLTTTIPGKVRKVFGVRAGGIFWSTAVDMGRVFDIQGHTNAELVDSEGFSIPDDINVFTNLSSVGTYVGGSISWIRNIGVSFDKYDDRVDDELLTLFLDILVTPGLTLDDVEYTERDTNGSVIRTSFYSTSIVSLNKFGVRAGLEGKFNRDFGWAYGGEVGLRPGLSGMGFYALVRISIPVFGSDLNYEVESFGQ